MQTGWPKKVEMDIESELQEAYTSVKNYIDNEWQAKYSSALTGQHCKTIQPKVKMRVRTSNPDRVHLAD